MFASAIQPLEAARRPVSHIDVTQQRHTTVHATRRRPRRRTVHLALRGGRWIWRRRLPQGLLRHFGTDDSTCGFRDIQIALGTGDRGVAVLRAAPLDAEFERLVAVPMGATAGQIGTVGQALSAFRKRVVTWSEAERAARPAGVRGSDALVAEWTIGGNLGQDLCAFAEQPGVLGQPLPLGLLARLTEALAPGSDTSGKSYGVAAGELASALVAGADKSLIRTSLLGETAWRAAVAEGRARFFERALLANDTDLAEEHLGRFEAEEGMTFEPATRRIMLRYALQVLAEVARDDARRDRGKYPAPEADPVMDLFIQSGLADGTPGVTLDASIVETAVTSVSDGEQEVVTPAAPAEAGNPAFAPRFMRRLRLPYPQLKPAQPIRSARSKSATRTWPGVSSANSVATLRSTR
ncbi:DUF6538 domain-containing protein [Pararoseomonas sp. SCSIO 73927]|uniref:DUF6538 domain-containing protein n=1 Tax=Pararoseomonas sp. SCSIO 73927 TaxID=3114537 RepID=UPI0030D3B25D